MLCRMVDAAALVRATLFWQRLGSRLETHVVSIVHGGRPSLRDMKIIFFVLFVGTLGFFAGRTGEQPRAPLETPETEIAGEEPKIDATASESAGSAAPSAEGRRTLDFVPVEMLEMHPFETPAGMFSRDCAPQQLNRSGTQASPLGQTETQECEIEHLTIGGATILESENCSGCAHAGVVGVFQAGSRKEFLLLFQACGGNACDGFFVLVDVGGEVPRELYKSEALIRVEEIVQVSAEEYEITLTSLGVQDEFGDPTPFTQVYNRSKTDFYASLAGIHAYEVLGGATLGPIFLEMVGAERFKEFREYFLVGSGTLLVDEQFLVGNGFVPHTGGSTLGLFALDILNGNTLAFTWSDRTPIKILAEVKSQHGFRTLFEFFVRYADEKHGITIMRSFESLMQEVNR